MTQVSLKQLALLLLDHRVGLWVDRGGQLRPCCFLGALSFLWWQGELSRMSFGCTGLKDLREPIEHFEHLGVELYDLLLGHCLLHGGSLVFLHHLSEEGGINGVDDVKDELTIALCNGILGEVLLQLYMRLNHLCQPLLAGVLVARHVNWFDLKAVEDLLLAL